jgi:flagella basal body P-ring formation protein FlgA
MFRLTVIMVGLLVAAPLVIGPALADQRVVVPVRDVPRGMTLSEADLAYQMMPRAQGGTAVSMSELAGMETRRYLHAGETVRLDDVKHPVIVAKGSVVTMIFEAPGVTLTATGKAMSEGGIGDSITVLNPVSYRQITCTVTGPGMVRAMGAGLTIPGQLAAR